MPHDHPGEPCEAGEVDGLIVACLQVWAAGGSSYDCDPTLGGVLGPRPGDAR